MDNIVEPSRLFQDLLELEKDFKYNLTLLKIRDSEIERCDCAIGTLQEALKSKQTEITNLTKRLFNVEEDLQKFERERDEEKRICRQTVVKLTENLRETTRKLQMDLEQKEEEFKNERLELETFYKTTIERKDEECRKTLAIVEDRLQAEICSTSKAKNQMQMLIDENMSLQNKIRQLDSQYTSEMNFYKNEFKTLKSTNSNLYSEIECLKKERGSLQDKFEKIKLENDDLNIKSNVCIKKISNLIKQNNENAEENNKLRHRIRENENLYRNLISDNERLSSEKNQLEIELSNLKCFLQNLKKGEHCNITLHNNYNFILKQNSMLQELIKAMRREREQFQMQNEENEKRIEKLEGVMRILKRSTFTKSNTDC